MSLSKLDRSNIKFAYSITWTTYKKLAEKYGCSIPTIRKILAGVTKSIAPTTQVHLDKLEAAEKKCAPLNGETFKEHPHYSNIWVSDFGRVVNRNMTYPNLKVSTVWLPSPYPHVIINVPAIQMFKGVHKKVYVHELVAETFIGLRPTTPKKPLYTVSHLDNNPLNNRVDNLKWETLKDNLRRSPTWVGNLRGKDHPAHGHKGRGGKLSLEIARSLREMRAKGISVWDLAQKYKISCSSVYLILQGKSYKDV